MVSISPVSNIAVKSDNSSKVKSQPAVNTEIKPNNVLSSDKISVGKSTNPTLKGAAAGALGVSAVAISLFAATGGFKQEGAILAAPLTVVGTIAGGFGGAIGAEDSKLKGTLKSAAAGAIAGGVLGAIATKDLGSAAVGAVAVGIVTGAGGFFGSLATKK